MRRPPPTGDLWLRLAAGAAAAMMAAAAGALLVAPEARAHGAVDPKEAAAFEAARPVFERHCARCHTKTGKQSDRESLKHFSMDRYPFGGHHSRTVAREIREVLGVAGKKATMPEDEPGAVKGEELIKILAWADAYDVARGRKPPPPRLPPQVVAPPPSAAAPPALPSPPAAPGLEAAPGSPTPTGTSGATPDAGQAAAPVAADAAPPAVPIPPPPTTPRAPASGSADPADHGDTTREPEDGDGHGGDHGDPHGARGDGQELPPGAAQMAYGVPRETLIPGTPGRPGGFHLMLNAYGFLQNVGLGGYTIRNPGEDFRGGTTLPFLTGDWIMGYGRDTRGFVEGLVMLNFEPLSIGKGGYPELGQSGDGLWDAQHAHQLFHQVVLAVHPLAGTAGGAVGPEHDGTFDLALFAGQGSATIGPPVFMHRASSPGPTVPRKHHKGENPHETFPMVGASFRHGRSWVEVSAFSGHEPGPDDSRLYPQIGHGIDSFAVRLRSMLKRRIEVQLSGERIAAHRDDPGAPARVETQSSGSILGWGSFRGWRVDWLLDAARVAPEGGQPSHAALLEVALRSPSLRDALWSRTEIVEREEPTRPGGPPGGVSGPWLFQALGAERVLLAGRRAGLQLGIFGEATYVEIPSALAGQYGRERAVTVILGLHLFGMWMLDSRLNRVSHHHGEPRLPAFIGR